MARDVSSIARDAMKRESPDFKIRKPPAKTPSDTEVEERYREALRATREKPSPWRDELKKIERPAAEKKTEPFTGITAAECNAWLASLPPLPLYGEEE